MKEQKVKLSAPKGASGVSYKGDEYYVEKGSIVVPESVVEHLVAQGYSVIGVEETKAERESRELAELEAEEKAKLALSGKAK